MCKRNSTTEPYIEQPFLSKHRLISGYPSGIISAINRNTLGMEPVPMIKKHQIYKKDKWNMMTVEINGTRFVLREISDQFGEECHTFLSRPALMKWVSERFPKEKFAGNEDEWSAIMEAFKKV
jgi:hypothetical protein